MATINNNGSYMALPIAIKRGNPIPLDTTAVWYDLAAMQAYAASGATAYVGQVLTYVNVPDEGEASVQVYVIKNTAGELQALTAGEAGDYIQKTGGTMTGDLVLKDGSKAASETYVATEIAKIGGLKYLLVEELPAKSDAVANTIYVVKDADKIAAGAADAYDEYIYIPSATEGEDGDYIQIGESSIDLAGYIQSTGTLVKGNILTVDDDGKVVDSGVAVPGEDDKYITESLLSKLNSLATIKTVSGNLELSSEGVLDVKKVDGKYVLNGLKVFDLSDASYNMTLADAELVANGAQLLADIATAHANGDDIAIKDGSHIYNVVEYVEGESNSCKAVVLAAGEVAENEGVLVASAFKRIFIFAVEGGAKVVSAACPDSTSIENQLATYLTDNNYITTADIATATTPGVVLSSTADDGVSVAADGSMTVNSLNATKLYLNDGDELTLSGGDSGVVTD